MHATAPTVYVQVPHVAAHAVAQDERGEVGQRLQRDGVLRPDVVAAEDLVSQLEVGEGGEVYVTGVPEAYWTA